MVSPLVIVGNFYFVRSVEYELSEMGTGTTFKAISGSDLRSISIPLAEQKRIVAKVDQLMKLSDELESQLQKSQKDSELLMQAVLQEAFER